MNEQEIMDMIKEMTILDESEEVKESDVLFDLGIDSLKLVEVIVSIEMRYDIEFSDTELSPSEIITVEDIISLTRKYVA